MNTQLMTLEQAIERRLAEIRQAEEEHERQIQEEARRRDETARRAVEWLCQYLRETEGIEIGPEDFEKPWTDGSDVINVRFQCRHGVVILNGGIHQSREGFEIIQGDGRPWRGTSGAVYSKCATFVDAVIYAGGQVPHD